MTPVLSKHRDQYTYDRINSQWICDKALNHMVKRDHEFKINWKFRLKDMYKGMRKYEMKKIWSIY